MEMDGRRTIIIPYRSKNSRDGERKMAGSDYFVFLIFNQISGIFLSSLPPAHATNNIVFRIPL
jgi:hypothetical protein